MTAGYTLRGAMLGVVLSVVDGTYSDPWHVLASAGACGAVAWFLLKWQKQRADHDSEQLDSQSKVIMEIAERAIKAQTEAVAAQVIASRASADVAAAMCKFSASIDLLASQMNQMSKTCEQHTKISHPPQPTQRIQQNEQHYEN